MIYEQFNVSWSIGKEDYMFSANGVVNHIESNQPRLRRPWGCDWGGKVPVASGSMVSRARPRTLWEAWPESFTWIHSLVLNLHNRDVWIEKLVLDIFSQTQAQATNFIKTAFISFSSEIIRSDQKYSYVAGISRSSLGSGFQSIQRSQLRES